MKNIRKIVFLFLLIGIFNIKNVSAETTLNCSKTLRYGSKGEQVKLLQKELNKVANCNLTVDGSFGPATKSCVLSFQRNNKLFSAKLKCSATNEEIWNFDGEVYRWENIEHLVV